jgi:hypothetical protein
MRSSFAQSAKRTARRTARRTAIVESSEQRYPHQARDSSSGERECVPRSSASWKSLPHYFLISLCPACRPSRVYSNVYQASFSVLSLIPRLQTPLLKHTYSPQRHRRKAASKCVCGLCTTSTPSRPFPFFPNTAQYVCPILRFPPLLWQRETYKDRPVPPWLDFRPASPYSVYQGKRRHRTLCHLSCGRSNGRREGIWLIWLTRLEGLWFEEAALRLRRAL